MVCKLESTKCDLEKKSIIRVIFIFKFEKYFNTLKRRRKKHYFIYFLILSLLIYDNVIWLTSWINKSIIIIHHVNKRYKEILKSNLFIKLKLIYVQIKDKSFKRLYDRIFVIFLILSP